jgi:flagellar biosynthetic protein FlhB
LAEESDLERTEEPSSTRLEKARLDGDIPRSREVSTALSLIVSAVAFYAFDAIIFGTFKQLMASTLVFSRGDLYEASNPFDSMFQQLSLTLATLLPLFICLLAVALFSPLALGGWSLSLKAIQPNIDRLNPLKGIGNLLSANAGIEVVKAILKTIVVGMIAYGVCAKALPVLLRLSHLPVEMGVSTLGAQLLWAFLLISFGTILIAAVDAPYQLHRYQKRLRMSKEELKQEYQQSDGRPEVRARIRRQQREIAGRQMWRDIPLADVVLLNPTHYAVAVKYKADEMHAPKVVAKGMNEIAQNIKVIAETHNVLMLDAPKLARALYAHVDIGHEIPDTLYLAVAEILAFVFELKESGALGKLRPLQPDEGNVPDELDPLRKFEGDEKTR